MQYSIIPHVTYYQSPRKIIRQDVQGVPRLIADIYFELQTNVKDNSVLFLSNNEAHLGFCFIPKSSISDHLLSHRVKERTGGHFKMEWGKIYNKR